VKVLEWEMRPFAWNAALEKFPQFQADKWSLATPAEAVATGRKEEWRLLLQAVLEAVLELQM
jgi:hypothetical protein